MVPNRNGRWKCSPSLPEMTTPPQEECSYPANNMRQYQTAASRCSGDFEGAHQIQRLR
ncbi:hypothetical protein L207DRAFT_257052 [Hyaloscypha variabilis F]|uniref:Uncharacterized protein n=1 Tax=Hyaloscypha variabilis (strain UAMH 11265 / GT02V1 / F) TaxID=1149755 RepID=A0A2J6S445_HYAVF|nr:hypothetical protein L207DRAFT_257052 [Hyaloscypha variabilis F]